MTAAQLVQMPQTYPPGLRVIVNGYDDMPPKQMPPAKMALSTGKHDWEGKHGDPKVLTGIAPDDAAEAQAPVLHL